MKIKTIGTNTIQIGKENQGRLLSRSNLTATIAERAIHINKERKSLTVFQRNLFTSNNTAKFGNELDEFKKSINLRLDVLETNQRITIQKLDTLINYLSTLIDSK